jgi:hypothetical protein
MTELVERYVHQVGRYLPPQERAEIEAELRSQIQDQLEDRYGQSPTPEEVSSVLKEFGHPYEMAASYSSDKYLVGPILYPYMMMVLRYVWLLVPAVVVFLNLFGALISSQPINLLSLFIDIVIGALHATLLVSAVVVLFFGLIQHRYLKIDAEEVVFNPLELPEVDDPRVVDRYEAIFGIAIGILFTFLFLYFLSVGGLTLRFNLSDPGEVIPVPTAWLVLLVAAVVGQIIMHLLVLRRSHWSAGLWILETVLEVVGVVFLYFAVLEPVFARVFTDNPALVDTPIIRSAPELIAVGMALITLVSKGSKLVKLWNYHSPPPYEIV